MTALRFDSIAISLAGRPVLRGVDFELAEGEVLVLAGRNGVGKTTLLRIATRILRPDAGEVRIDGPEGTFRPRLAPRHGGDCRYGATSSRRGRSNGQRCLTPRAFRIVGSVMALYPPARQQLSAPVAQVDSATVS